MKLRTLTLALSTLLSTTAMAHDNECNVDIQGNLEYNDKLITVEMDNGRIMKISPDNTLTLDGQTVLLNDDQQDDVEDYREAIDEAVPMTVNLVSDSIELAGTAVGEVFGKLLGPDDSMVTDFKATLSDMRSEMENHFYTDNGSIRVTKNDFDGDGWFDSTWESKFEERIEDMVTEATGKLLVAIGSQIMSGDGDMDDFETRMENFAENLEEQLESKAETIEDQAETLCRVLREADKAEGRMQASIPGLEELDLLNIKYDSDRM
ncbi:DUF2884 family protein [Salinimonas chungwhensis]|uniref:DUF2884 family protein n=1 Tax=Salinimonas chungwhensis TaxID=265425 RepID=UPI00035F68EA|nr:DUF2884 family protein [Salinimonas chungwhensis]